MDCLIVSTSCSASARIGRESSIGGVNLVGVGGDVNADANCSAAAREVRQRTRGEVPMRMNAVFALALGLAAPAHAAPRLECGTASTLATAAAVAMTSVSLLPAAAERQGAAITGGGCAVFNARPADNVHDAYLSMNPMTDRDWTCAASSPRLLAAPGEAPPFELWAKVRYCRIAP
jgi:hypothetical protein